MRENRLYGSVGGWGLNRPPPTQSLGPHHIRVQYHWGRTTTEVVLRLAQARLPELQTLHWEH